MQNTIDVDPGEETEQALEIPPPLTVEPTIDKADDVWGDASALLQQQLDAKFSAWFGRARAAGFDGETFVLAVPSTFVKQWIESQYLGFVQDALRETTGKTLSVAIVADETLATEHDDPAPEAVPIPALPEVARPSEPEEGPHFHPKYTFDSFVIGSSNRFAHAAALAVGEAPAEAYNPLFIYGGAGLGKTHLLHAIGRYVKECHSHSVVRYVSTEQFTNEFVLAVQRRTIPQFHQRFRVADLLLIDDIQFLEGKERTQEEFFHTFNALHPKSQIVITSDRPPKKIPTLEEQ